MRSGAPRELLQDADELGHEARATSNDHLALKLWLRMLSCATQIETEIRRRLRKNFGVSLARFDYMAQLFRKPDGLKMSELSSYLMVTGGNVTGLTDELDREGLVTREANPADRRVWIVRLTPKGRRSFETMAGAHEKWILELFAGLNRVEMQQLHALLGELRVHFLRNGQSAKEQS